MGWLLAESVETSLRRSGEPDPTLTAARLRSPSAPRASSCWRATWPDKFSASEAERPSRSPGAGSQSTPGPNLRRASFGYSVITASHFPDTQTVYDARFSLQEPMPYPATGAIRPPNDEKPPRSTATTKPFLRLARQLIYACPKLGHGLFLASPRPAGYLVGHVGCSLHLVAD
jgi:hypothetical protein